MLIAVCTVPIILAVLFYLIIAMHDILTSDEETEYRRAVDAAWKEVTDD